MASGSDALEAARAALQSTPIVGISSNMGIGGSLARSAGNLTGMSLLFDELAAKWPELLVEAVPRVERMGWPTIAFQRVDRLHHRYERRAA